ncbi:MAG: DNA polymerase III subunit gamma/tau [Magnetococcales bacterium]|nr:DNA polymerase III subunit gamma/tau [Magnetococcales bacterium]
MSDYVVLARRWRPRSFDTLVGQEHVTRALVNALDGGRLSHAFLFSGIRGTGKTTLARLLALCLNCEQGTTSKPCGACGSCREIIAGHHPDVMEVDAASRTKVEQMRELLDMVAYAPTHSRFRIFILDEVHMLSVPSFNALLKTLEEPPSHVKFLFATTELRKLPATILSRCQRYELRRVAEDVLLGHMAYILDQEGIAYENKALALVAQAAEGSVRDSLSLLDQVIAHGGGAVAHATVEQLLGLTNRETIHVLLSQILTGDGKGVLETVANAHQNGVEPEMVVRDLLARLHGEVRGKVIGIPVSQGDGAEWSGRLPESVTLEHLQMVYMVLNKGGNELHLTDRPWRALEMLLLRVCYLAPVPDLGKLIRVLGRETTSGGGGAVAPPVSQGPSAASSSPAAAARGGAEAFPGSWKQMVGTIRRLEPTLGMILNAQLACPEYRVPDAQGPGHVALVLVNDCFGTPEEIRNKVQGFISRHFQATVTVVVTVGADSGRPETLQETKVREAGETLSQLESDVHSNPVLQSLRTRFNAEIVSIAPTERVNLH